MTKRREPFPIVGSFNQDQILKINSEDTVNMYEVVDPDIVSGGYLSYWPGKLETLTFANAGVMRASIVHKNIAYVVVGDSVYQIDNALTVTAIGPAFFGTVTGYVGATANENQIVFVDGSTMFVWDIPTLAILPVTLPTGAIPKDVTTMDSYTIMISNGANQQNIFFVSKLNEAQKWDDPTAAGSFALVNSRPTILTCVEVLKRRVFLFGQVVSEVWLDAGDSDFPFRRDNNLLLEHGITAQDTLVEGFDRLFYLSTDKSGIGSVMMITGTTPQPISTIEIDELIQTFTHPEQATGFVFKISGQIFYQLSFTHADDNKTLVYNASTNKWHRLETLQGNYDYAVKHFYLANKHLVGSALNNKLYEINADYLTNNGERIPRIRICKPFKSPTLNRVRIDEFLVELLQGVGLKTFGADIDTNPRMILSISEDGGESYQYEDTAEIGKSGERLKRTFWSRLGTRREAIIKIEIISAVPIYIISAVINYEVLPS